jgi:hypothetical protein
MFLIRSHKDIQMTIKKLIVGSIFSMLFGSGTAIFAGRRSRLGGSCSRVSIESDR